MKRKKQKTKKANSSSNNVKYEKNCKPEYTHPMNRLPEEVIAHHKALDAAVRAGVRK